MATEIFTVQNVKCGGCVTAITNGLSGLDGIDAVEVDIPSGRVTVNGSALQREALVVKLAELGYPEA
jgi:copper chaperone